MYDHYIVDMVSLFIEKGIITQKQNIKAITVLKKYWEDKIAIVWQSEDIIDYAKQKKKKISKEKAIDILQTMFRRYDCEYGITWDTIDANL